MAEKLAELNNAGMKVKDSGALSYSNTDINASDSRLRCLRFGNIVQLHAIMYPDQDIGLGIALATIPLGYRPMYGLTIWALGGAYNTEPVFSMLELNENGVLKVGQISTGVKRTRYYNFDISYITKD